MKIARYSSAIRTGRAMDSPALSWPAAAAARYRSMLTQCRSSAATRIIHGLTLLLHDVSPEISLEQRCRSLHELATKDPLTQVANRAEFDRVHELFVAAHRESNRPVP